VSGIAECVFATLFPTDCRFCGAPLIKISRLPVCEVCVAQMRPISVGLCWTCGERIASPFSSPTGRGILLVGDVFTTGTTVWECARILRPAGASKVYVATGARILKAEGRFMALPQGQIEQMAAAG